MKIRGERDDLADLFSRANRAVAARSALPVLQGLLCDASAGNLTVTGTDLEVTVATSGPVEVMEDGRAVIPGRLLAEAVRKMPPGVVTITVNGGEVEILGKGPRFTLRTLTLDDFPNLDMSAVDGVEVDGEELINGLAQVVVAASSDSARPILTGVLFEPSEEGLRLVTTDSYRLGVRELPGMGSIGSGLVPARGLRELGRTIGAEKIRAGMATREAVFTSERGSLRLRLIEGSFPKYRTLFSDSYPSQVTMKKEDVLEALGRVSLVAEDHIPVRLKIGNGGVEVNVTRQDVGGEVEHLDAEFVGVDEITIAFNPRYLGDGVAAINGDNIRIQIIDPLKATVLDNGESDGFVYLLMPVRI
ncbi:MAG: DNA polymerase III subunit beta [Acidimicrobiia bacterium]|nr:DNA polymerase III subunit beta [Acidimicrobiia bacterium]MDQ3500054.1 DNA polymerase III subunit beta [Actinomycetota bacterium]